MSFCATAHERERKRETEREREREREREMEGEDKGIEYVHNTPDHVTKDPKSRDLPHPPLPVQ